LALSVLPILFAFSHRSNLSCSSEVACAFAPLDPHVVWCFPPSPLFGSGSSFFASILSRVVGPTLFALEYACQFLGLDFFFFFPLPVFFPHPRHFSLVIVRNSFLLFPPERFSSSRSFLLLKCSFTVGNPDSCSDHLPPFLISEEITPVFSFRAAT